ncbi:MAG: hypothetical protein AAFX40_17015 [Cyanobacteria bacterium J06639_1]
MQSEGTISQAFRDRGLETFHEACQWTLDLAYGSNSSSENSEILFEEMRGTCTTKHGAIARLAEELGLPVVKKLGFYRLNDAIVTGVDDIIRPKGLEFIPQIHCFLGYETFRVDLTAGNCNGKNQIIDDYDFIVPVKPDLTSAEHQACYLEYLDKYFETEPALKALGSDRILELLEACDRQVSYRCSIMLQLT